MAFTENANPYTPTSQPFVSYFAAVLTLVPTATVEGANYAMTPVSAFVWRRKMRNASISRTANPETAFTTNVNP